MKKQLIFLAFTLLTTGAFTQKKGQDYVVRKADGKMVWMRSGQPVRMMIDVPLKNGSTVNYKGIIKSKDGETIQLNSGDKVMMDGTVLKRKKGKS